MARRVVTSGTCVNAIGVSVVPDSCDLKRGKQPRNNVVAGNDGDIKESQSDSLGFIVTIRLCFEHGHVLVFPVSS